VLGKRKSVAKLVGLLTKCHERYPEIS